MQDYIFRTRERANPSLGGNFRSGALQAYRFLPFEQLLAAIWGPWLDRQVTICKKKNAVAVVWILGDHEENLRKPSGQNP